MKLVWLVILALAAGHDKRTSASDRPVVIAASAQIRVKVSHAYSGPLARSRRWDLGPFGIPGPSIVVEDCDTEEPDDSWLLYLAEVAIGPDLWLDWARPRSSIVTSRPHHFRFKASSRIPLRC